MANTSSDRTLVALLELKEDELDRSLRSQSDADGRSSLPTLNERVEMYLRAVHGSEHVATADERAAAREQLLSAMAADLADGTVNREPPLPDPQTRAQRLEPTRSSVRAPKTSANNVLQSIAQLLLVAVEAFTIPRMRMVAVPLVALLVVGTALTSGLLNRGPIGGLPSVADTSDTPSTGIPPRTTRSLNPAENPQADNRSEELLRQDVASAGATFGPTHPNVAGALVKLADFYRLQARYSEAEALYKRALAIREAALGPSHPDVASTLNQLALIYRAQGRTREAEELARRAAASKR